MDRGNGLSKFQVRRSGVSFVEDPYIATNVREVAPLLTHSGVSFGEDTYITIDIPQIAPLLTCPLCNEIWKEATTINRCNHTFCKECITQKVQADERPSCPTCQEDLSSFTPDQYLRANPNRRYLIEVLFGNSTSSAREETSEARTPQVAGATSQPEANKEIAELDKKIKVQKKKRNKRRRARQFSSVQKQEEEKDKPNNDFDESNAFSEKNVEASAENKFSSVWFHLVPDESDHAYRKLTKPYIHIKDGDLPASIINKFLAKKLNLESGDEVEVCCLGVPLIGSLALGSIIDMWIESVTSSPNYLIVAGKAKELEEKKFVMEMTYRKSKKQELPKQN